MLTDMEAGALVRSIRDQSHLSVRSLGDAAGVAASTVHRIERGDLQPTVDTLRRLAEAAGFHLRLEPETDYGASLIGLGRSVVVDLASGNESLIIRRAAELAHRFDASDSLRQRRMIAGEPDETGDEHWDAFLGALAAWLACCAGIDTPVWATEPRRYLHHGWWPAAKRSMRAWEYAGSPISFQQRGIYLHRDSLLNV